MSAVRRRSGTATRPGDASPVPPGIPADSGPASPRCEREGPAVVADGLLVGQAPRGVPGGGEQQVDPAVALQLLPGEVGVAGEVPGPHRVAEAAVRVQRPYGGGVTAAGVRVTEGGVQRLAQQVVGEGVTPGGARDDDPGDDRRLQQPLHLGDRGTVHHGQDLPAELPAEHGGGGQQRDDRVRQQAQPLPDRLPDPGRNGGDGASAVPEPGRLLDEERVAAGAPVDFVDQLRRGLAARRHGHQRPYLVAAQAGQREGGRGA
ncbi:hypothetical protein [Streptomyces microflavus]|uniref:hypothetical protein n=1 Tax=Streptomyces microflavus TaxID=1919 RepID=UPI0033AD0AC3